MKKMLLAVLLVLVTKQAHAGASYLGTSLQDVNILSQTGGSVLIQSTNTLNTAVVSPLPTGANNIGTVTGSTVNINGVGVTGNSLNVNVTADNVSGSTVGIRGSGGLLDSEIVGTKNSLDVLNKGRANLNGLSFVYRSSDNFVVGNSITLTGLANEVDLQAINNDCTFNINGGDNINVAKNTAEVFNFDYTQTNLVVNLTAKTGTATCKARITGAN